MFIWETSVSCRQKDKKRVQDGSVVALCLCNGALRGGKPLIHEEEKRYGRFKGGEPTA